MSRFGRAVDKADREGLLTWTQGGNRAARGAAVEELPTVAPVAYAEPASPSTEVDLWDDEGAPGTHAAFNPVLVAATDPNSAAAEQFRLLRTRLEGHDNARRTHLVLVSSPGVGDGKTTTSANLALTMAQEFQHKVVLIEADLRRPRLADLFGVRSEPGLMDVLAGAAPLDEAIITVPGSRLSILPAGLPGSRPGSLLTSSMMQRTLEALRSRFDRIVVDAAPLLLADTHVLARLADGVLMVVRAGVTARPTLERALAGVEREKLVGFVLNGVDETPNPYYTPGVVSQGTGT